MNQTTWNKKAGELKKKLDNKEITKDEYCKSFGEMYDALRKGEKQVLNWKKENKTEVLKSLAGAHSPCDKIADYVRALAGDEIMTFSSGYDPEDPKASILGKRIVKEGTVKDSQHGGGYIHADLVEWRGILVFVDQSTETIIDISAKDAERFEAEVAKIIESDGVESLFYSKENNKKWSSN